MMRLNKFMGAAKSASNQEIQQAYRNLALQLHPRRYYPHNGATHNAGMPRQSHTYENRHGGGSSKSDDKKEETTWFRPFLGLGVVVIVGSIMKAWHSRVFEGVSETLRENHKAELEELKKRHKRELEELQRRHKRELEEFEKRHKRELEELQKRHEAQPQVEEHGTGHERCELWTNREHQERWKRLEEQWERKEYWKRRQREREEYWKRRQHEREEYWKRLKEHWKRHQREREEVWQRHHRQREEERWVWKMQNQSQSL